jgi:hypothetical protein
MNRTYHARFELYSIYKDVNFVFVGILFFLIRMIYFIFGVFSGVILELYCLYIYIIENIN